MKLNRLTFAMLGIPALLGAGATQAQTASTATLRPVEVRDNQQELSPSLRQSAATGSRLGLSVKETPASIEVIGQDLIEQRGARSFEEVLRGGVGMTAGGNPGAPSVGSTRGFTTGFVSYLFDGSRVGTASMTSRPQDTWNYERVEILKGPASVLYGEGAIGGIVNFVTRRPDRNNPAREAMLSYGSFHTVRAAAGLGTAVGEEGALRLDYSHQQSKGYIERNRQRMDNLTLGYATRLARDVKLELSMDYLHDDALAYQGSVLVPAGFATQPTGVVSDTAGRVLDRRFAFKNYNVNDAVMDSTSVWTRARLNWAINTDWTLRNELSYYTADRRWRNAESYSFAAPGLLNRDLVDISHDHQVLTNRLDLTNTGRLAGLANRFVVGMEYTRTRFGSERRFSDGSAATNAALRVDILNPVYGNYIDDPALYTGAGNRTSFSTRIPTLALFAEDALSLTPQWTVIGGLRLDRIRLERGVFDLNTAATTAFSQTFNPVSARLGTVFALDADTSLYAQYTNATAPVGTGNLLLLSAFNSTFNLSKGTQAEVGIKQSLLGGRLDYTLALYRIKLSNILTRDSTTPAVTVNSGAQSSRGLELSAAWRATRQLSLSGNLAVVDARYDSLVEAGGVSRAGNRPANVPARVANLWLNYRLDGVPVKLGAGINYVGGFYTSTANTTRINAATTVDAHATWDIHPGGSLTLRVRNLADKLYATWAGISGNQVMVGAPRSVEVSYRAAF